MTAGDGSGSPAVDERDAFFWYIRMDMATTLAARQTGLITDEQAGRIARGISAVSERARADPAARPADYLDVQSLLLDEVGADASRMHAGRSRQDMLATLHRLVLRDRLLVVFEGLLRVRHEFLNKGQEYLDVPVPTYTNGVQAQPALFAHLLCGYEAPLARSGQRYREAFTRLNQSPLGSAALATSRFDVDRASLADFLGFDEVVDNAFDAAQLGLVDSGLECAQVAAVIATNLNMFIQDVHATFRHTNPWLRFDDPSLVSPSTLMPQKRNPVVLNRARLLGSEVIGASITATLAAHNVGSGFTDYKRADAVATLDVAVKLLAETRLIVHGVSVDDDAALAELMSGFTTTSELAALLQELTGVPLGVTHRFAADVVDFCRAHELSIDRVPHETVQALFASAVETSQIQPVPPFPLSAEQFAIAVHPATMIANYRPQGGSSPSEVRRMLDEGGQRLEGDRRWLSAVTDRLSRHADQLDEAFAALVASGPGE